MALLLIAFWLGAADANAQPSELAMSEGSPARTEVVFGTIGIRAEPVRGSLIALLAAQLRGLNLSLIEGQPDEPLSEWASEVTSSGRVLAVILLDGRSEQGWRLVIIDAARGRAIIRALSGGIRNDAASVEAVASIVLSAASALREGLEVASTPLAVVVGGSPKPPPPVLPGRAVRERPLVPHGSRRQRWAARGQIGPTLASFSPSAPATPGLTLALGITFRAWVEARAFGAAFLPPLIQSPLGEFRVARSWLGAAAGPVFGVPAFSFVPEAGVVTERVRRYGATAAAGVYSTEPSALYRIGGLLALRLRHTLLRPLSLELVAGGIYFGRRLDFTAKSAGSTWSEGVWPATVFAQLGLQIATD